MLGSGRKVEEGDGRGHDAVPEREAAHTQGAEEVRVLPAHAQPAFRREFHGRIYPMLPQPASLTFHTGMG